MLHDDVRFQHTSADQMLLDDGFEHGRVAFPVPRAVRVDDGNRAAFADAEAVGLGAQDAALLRKAQLLEAPLQKVPGRQAPLLVAALRVGLVAAEKDVPPGHRDADRLGNLHLGIGQNNFTSTTVPFSTTLSLAAISMYPSACDMLVMSPDALKAGTAVPSTILTV